MLTLDDLSGALEDAGSLLHMAVEEQDEETVDALVGDLESCEEKISRLEFQRMFAGEMDRNNAFLDIQAGSGGTEAQDWAEMLLRMYLRWAEAKGFKAELVECSAGDVAGIKSATINIGRGLRLRLAAHRNRGASPGAKIAL